jgi:hypothetical protein
MDHADTRQEGSKKYLLIGKSCMKFQSTSVRISYALLHLWEIPRFLSTQRTRGLLAFNLTPI